MAAEVWRDWKEDFIGTFYADKPTGKKVILGRTERL
jgi:hypothetical protein